jgi:SAM-dependent methyltransferase
VIRSTLAITKRHIFQCLQEIDYLVKGTKPHYKTEILGLPLEIRNGFWVGGLFKSNNLAKGYHGILAKWWSLTELAGKVAIVGESNREENDIKRRLLENYPKISEILTIDLENADIIWDITTELKDPNEHFDHIICQAVLEHVKDPVASVKNMAMLLNENGFMYLHSHGPDFPYHPYPIDCYRFQRDGTIALAELANLNIVDMYWTKSHWFLLLKQVTKTVSDLDAKRG